MRHGRLLEVDARAKSLKSGVCARFEYNGSANIKVVHNFFAATFAPSFAQEFCSDDPGREGGAVKSHIFRSVMIAVVVLGAGIAAKAEELVMPFSCHVDGSGVYVRPAGPTSYKILGVRDEQPFADCAPRRPCRTLMVHRFAIACGGKSVPWVRVAAAAARETSAAMPAKLPAGFAPVSTLSGRFVLPAAMGHGTAVAKVSRQSLSADSVVRSADDDDTIAASGWETEVRADNVAPAPDGQALRVAASLAGMMAFLFAASLVAARRVRFPAFAGGSSVLVRFRGAARFLERVTETIEQLRARAARWQDWDDVREQRASPDILNAISSVQARLLHLDLKVGALDAGLLLREVLIREVAGLRARLADFEGALPRMPITKAAVSIRAMLRDLERIDRIAESAVRDSRPGDVAPNGDVMPETEVEAYRILGINPDASPAAAKKLVDALRMSWHPDHGRDSGDRARREQRMKQINAAWDLVKDRHRAAA